MSEIVVNVSKDELQGKHCGALSLKCRKSGNADDDTYAILKSNWAFKNPETDSLNDYVATCLVYKRLSSFTRNM